MVFTIVIAHCVVLAEELGMSGLFLHLISLLFLVVAHIEARDAAILINFVDVRLDFPFSCGEEVGRV